MKMDQDIQKVLFTSDEIHEANKRLGNQLSQDYAGKNPLFVCILKGAVIFMTDLIRQYDGQAEIDFMDVSSYNGGTTTSGQVKILKDLDCSVEGRDVIFVEDIVDTGTTLAYLMKMFKARNAKSVKMVSLIDKLANRQKNVDADYVGLHCPDGFIVGYGMDYQEHYRNLPYIGILKSDVYE